MNNDLAKRLKEALLGKPDPIPKGWMSCEELGEMLGLKDRQTRETAWAGVKSGILESKRFRLIGRNGAPRYFTYFKEIVK